MSGKKNPPATSRPNFRAEAERALMTTRAMRRAAEAQAVKGKGFKRMNLPRRR